MTNTLNSMIIKNTRRERVYQVVITDLYRLGVLEDDEVKGLLGYVPKKPEPKKVVTTTTTPKKKVNE